MYFVLQCSNFNDTGGAGESRTRVLPNCRKAFYTLMPQLSFGAPLYGRKGAPAEILNRPLCRLHVKTAVPRLIDARSLPAGKRCRRAAMVKRRAQTGCLRGYLHFQHLNLGRMFYRGHSFLGVLTSPRIGNRNRCCPVWRAAVCAFGQGRDFPPRQCIIRHCAQKCNRLCKRRGESRPFRRRRGVFGTKSRKPAPGEGCARKTGTLSRGVGRMRNFGENPSAGESLFLFCPKNFRRRCRSGAEKGRRLSGKVQERAGERGGKEKDLRGREGEKGQEEVRGRRAARKRARLLYKTARLRYNKEKARGSAAEKIQRVRGRRAPRR